MSRIQLHFNNNKIETKTEYCAICDGWTSRVHVDHNNSSFFFFVSFSLHRVLLLRQTIFMLYLLLVIFDVIMSFTRSVVFTSAPLAAYWCERCTTSDKHLITFTVYRREAILSHTDGYLWFETAHITVAYYFVAVQTRRTTVVAAAMKS